MANDIYPEITNGMNPNFSDAKMQEIYARNPSWAKTPGANTAQTTTTPTTPTTSQSQASGIDFSGLLPQFNVGLSQSTGNNSSYSGLNDYGRSQLQGLLGGGLSADLQRRANEISNNYRVTGRDIINQMNQVANQRAAMGIMGGTEAENLRSNMLYSLMKDTLDNRANAQTQAMQLEAQAIPQLLSLARENTSTGTTNSNNFSYGQSPQDYQIMLQALMNLY